jgi:hypothetical protein
MESRELEESNANLIQHAINFEVSMSQQPWAKGTYRGEMD